MNIRSTLLLIVAVILPSLARAEPVVPVAMFGNAQGSTLTFATGQTNGARSAAIMAEIPASDGSRRNIVVIFDKEHWPRFRTMWRKARYCLTAMENDSGGSTPMSEPGPFTGGAPSGYAGPLCSIEAVDDNVAGTSVALFADTSEEVVTVVVSDKAGERAAFPFANDNPRPLHEISEAVGKISDYLNQATPAP